MSNGFVMLNNDDVLLNPLIANLSCEGFRLWIEFQNIVSLLTHTFEGNQENEITIEILEFYCRRDVRDALQELIEVGLVTVCDDYLKIVTSAVKQSSRNVTDKRNETSQKIPKSQAQRAKEYRERKKLQEEQATQNVTGEHNKDRHETSQPNIYIEDINKDINVNKDEDKYNVEVTQAATETNNNDQKKTTSKKTSYPEEFEDFWNNFPKRTGGKGDKKAALKAWKIARESHDLEVIETGVARYINFCTVKNQNPDYIKKPQRFLEENQFLEGWEVSKTTKGVHHGLNQKDHTTPEYIGPATGWAE